MKLKIAKTATEGIIKKDVIKTQFIKEFKEVLSKNIEALLPKIKGRLDKKFSVAMAVLLGLAGAGAGLLAANLFAPKKSDNAF